MKLNRANLNVQIPFMLQQQATEKKRQQEILTKKIHIRTKSQEAAMRKQQQTTTTTTTAQREEYTTKQANTTPTDTTKAQEPYKKAMKEERKIQENCQIIIYNTSKITKEEQEELQKALASIGQKSKPIAEGATGKIYTATVGNKQYAVKQIHKEILGNDGAKNVDTIITQLRQLHQECRHKAIIELYGIKVCPSDIYLLMDYCSIGSLHTLGQQKGKLPEPLLAEVAYQALHALQYAHSKSVTHNDIKPQNLLLQGETGQLKMGFFGMSNKMRHTIQADVSHQSTYCYMSPERFYGAQNAGSPADIWSLGVSLYTCAVGHHPLVTAEEDSPVSLWNYSKMFVNDHAINSKGTSDLFSSFVHACDATDPDKRATATELLKHPWILKYCPYAAKGELLAKYPHTASWVN